MQIRAISFSTIFCLFFAVVIRYEFFLSSMQRDIKRDLAMATSSILFSGGEIFRIGYNCTDIPGIDTCNGVWSCGQTLCQIAQDPFVSYAGFRPAIPLSNCSNTEVASEERLGHMEEYVQLQNSFYILDILIINLAVLLFVVWIMHIFTLIPNCQPLQSYNLCQISFIFFAICAMATYCALNIVFILTINNIQIFEQQQESLNLDSPPAFVTTATKRMVYFLCASIIIESITGLLAFFLFCLHTLQIHTKKELGNAYGSISQ